MANCLNALNDVINTMATDTELSDGLALKVNVSDYNTDKDALNTTITNEKEFSNSASFLYEVSRKEFDNVALFMKKNILRE